ncbi:hypothetical protein Enr17x_17390 [Gimesia fumaroli]|jgi:hypothetical protein|uniref:Uncharacterized protein n=1 Tax=Gimesia fumaroli TaxID=2527976 RepID=A0A518I9D3_9PLAN|nr:hypothetical protein Enr17x_17390 [Gimesia fumaroli]
MRVKDIFRVGAIICFASVWALGADCYLNQSKHQVLSAAEMRVTLGAAAACVDKVSQDNCTSEFSGCVPTSDPVKCSAGGCVKCTTDAAYSDCTTTGGTNYKTCNVTTTAGGCGTINTAPCEIQSGSCKCGTYVATTNACGKKEVTSTTPCPGG